MELIIINSLILILLIVITILVIIGVKLIEKLNNDNLRMFEQDAEWTGEIIDVLYDIKGVSRELSMEQVDKTVSEEEMMDKHTKQYDDLRKNMKRKNKEK